MPHDLDRFVQAQSGVYAGALAELRRGQKTGHWIWFVFPQLVGLGHSETSRFYGISSLDEAQAYLAHPVLGPRLRECAAAVLSVAGRSADEILGSTDAMKLRSSMTLFHRAAPDEPLFREVLVRYFAGVADSRTDGLLRLVSADRRPPAPDRFALVPAFPALETDRLILRQLTEADAPWYLAHFSRPEIVAGSGFPAPVDLAAAREELDRYVIDLFARRTGIRWGLVLRGEHELIGSAGLYGWRESPEPAAEIGYDLAPEYWGRGLMTEAVNAIVRFAFDVLGIAQLTATVIVRNERSCRTLERAGFRHEGVLAAHGKDEDGRVVDEHLFARRRTD